MRLADELTIRPGPVMADGSPTSELLLSNQPTGRLLAGAVFEAAVQSADGYVVFVTEGIPYEDALHIHLLDGALRLRDSATIGAAFVTGAFTDLTLVDPDLLRFRFAGDFSWCVELFDAARWRLPWLTEPSCVSRRYRLRRWFGIRAVRAQAL
jgi:hypothetical protein